MGNVNPIYTSFKIPLRGKLFGNLWHVKCYKKERKGKIKNKEIRKKEKHRKKKEKKKITIFRLLE
jgi:predicted histidine transporter YuiF (NhaC family)